MKAVFGVNQIESAHSAIRLLGRLDFANAEVHTVCVVEPFYPYAPAVAPGVAMPVGVDFSAIERSAREHCEKVGAEACEHLSRFNVRCRSSVAVGKAPEVLEEYAQKIEADLIAVGSTGKSTLEAFLFGSVTRHLSAHSDRSLLIGRGELMTQGKVKAVFATDHSDYASKAVVELLRLNPRGFERVTVLTVFDLDVRMPIGTALAAPETLSLEHDRLVSEIHSQNRRIRDSLSSLGCETNALEVRGLPNEKIREVMEQTESELLVLGAQGHGALRRLVMGSVAHHQVAQESYPVLVLRPQASSGSDGTV